jgi:hypothetical protein
MLETYRAKEPPPQARTFLLKPKLRSWTGRVWRSDPQNFQLMLKFDASLSLSEIEDTELRACLAPFAAQLSSFALYLDYGAPNRLPAPWPVGILSADLNKDAFVRFYDFLETARAHVLVPLVAGAGAQSDLMFSVIPFNLEADRVVFAITDYDLGFHNRIG